MRKHTIAAIVIACLLAFCLTSCSTVSSDVHARAHRVWESNMDYSWHRDSNVSFLEVNPLARKGDTLYIDETFYVIDSIDTTKGGAR